MINVSIMLRKWTVLFGALLAGVVLSGCAGTSGGSGKAQQAAVAAAASAGQGTDSVLAPIVPPAGAEVLKVGDYLTVKYDDLPIMVPPFDGQIKSDGTITLILNQKFDAAGKTVGELEQAIRKAYVPNYFKNMTVTVKPVNESRIFYIGGEVRVPGRQMYVPGITVYKAIQSAGYFTDFANQKKVKLIRADGKGTITIDIKKVIRNASKDVEVYPNDTIHVPRSMY